MGIDPLPDAAPSAGPAPPADDPLAIRTAIQDGTALIALYGELDLANVERVAEALRRAEAARPSEIVIDLSGLEFIDSSGLRLFVLAERRSREGGGWLKLLRGGPAVQRAFEVIGLDATMPWLE